MRTGAPGAAQDGDADGVAWLEVRVDAPPGADEADVERLEAWLGEAGALSVTFLDAEEIDEGGVGAGTSGRGVDTDASLAHAVLEPAPGETRLWRRVTLVGLFERGSEAADVRADLAEAAGAFGLDPAPVTALRRLADRAWERVWMDDFRAMRFGPRFVVAPHHLLDADGGEAGAERAVATRAADGAGEEADPVEISDDDVVLALDPGLAFGTGTHATTAQCLEWLGARTDRDRRPFAGRGVIDYGCGSGVLAIAALLLGAERAVAVDIDPQALEATRANARANGVDGRLVVGLPAILDGAAPADVLLANILHGPLEALADTLAGLVRPGGSLVLSGLLTTQSEALRVRYTRAFVFEPDASRDGWALLSATRRDVPSPGRG